MENQGDTTQKNAETSKKTSVKEFLEGNVLVVVFLVMVSSFGAGISAYRGLLDITNQETVIKGCCIPKDQIVGTILKNEAVTEIDHLIESGQSLGNDDAKTRIWLMEVLAFIHGLDLPQDWEYTFSGRTLKVSAIEGDIRYALEDPSVPIQAQKTLGVLKGFRASLQTRVTK